VCYCLSELWALQWAEVMGVAGNSGEADCRRVGRCDRRTERFDRNSLRCGGPEQVTRKVQVSDLPCQRCRPARAWGWSRACGAFALIRVRAVLVVLADPLARQGLASVRRRSRPGTRSLGSGNSRTDRFTLGNKEAGMVVTRRRVRRRGVSAGLWRGAVPARIIRAHPTNACLVSRMNAPCSLRSEFRASGLEAYTHAAYYRCSGGDAFRFGDRLGSVYKRRSRYKEPDAPRGQPSPARRVSVGGWRCLFR
jgi:hypothetical protein